MIFDTSAKLCWNIYIPRLVISWYSALSLLFQFQLVSSEWNFQTREPPQSYFSCSFFRFNVPITKFFIFSFESTHQAMMFPEKIFWFPPKAIFLMIIWSLQNLRHFVTPFALVSSWLDWGREVGGSRTLIPLKLSDLVVSFSIMENYHGKCLRDVLQHIANGSSP